MSPRIHTSTYAVILALAIESVQRCCRARLCFTCFLWQWQKIQTIRTHAITIVGAARLRRKIVDGIGGLVTMGGVVTMGGIMTIGGLVTMRGLVTTGIHRPQSWHLSPSIG